MHKAGTLAFFAETPLPYRTGRLYPIAPSMIGVYGLRRY